MRVIDEITLRGKLNNDRVCSENMDINAIMLGLEIEP
jgi:hypothetical protein